MNERELREKRAAAWEQMKAILDGAAEANRATTAEEDQTYDRLEAEVTELSSKIERAKRHAATEAVMERAQDHVVPPAGDGHQGDRRDQGAQREGRVTATQEYRDAFHQFLGYGARGVDADLQTHLRAAQAELPSEVRALGVAADAAGGYLAPDDVRDQLIELLTSFSPIRQFVEVVTTDSGEDIMWPTVTDAEVGAILAENTAMGEGDLSFGRTSPIGAYTYTSKIVRVSLQLLTDSFVDVEGLLNRRFRDRIGRIQNLHYMTGTGTGQPQGIVPNVAVGKTGPAGQLTSVKFDDLIDLEHSVDPLYRANGRFLVHDLTVASLRKTKDNNGAYIWQPSTREGEPDRINGKPYAVVNDMPQMGANARSVLFGDFREAYVIRDVAQVIVMRLSERYAEYLQVGFLAFHRSDGRVQNANAVKAFVHAAA